MPGRPPPRGKAPKRSRSAPPQRPADGENSAAPQQDNAGDGGEPATLDGELVVLPAGKNYDSADEDDGPTGEVLEGADLIGVPDKAPIEKDVPAAGGSPTREKTVLTNAKETTKELTKSQQQHAADQAKWSALKTDGSEQRRFPRPAFQPYKEGTAPDGFVAGPQHEKGGPRPELRAKLSHQTHPAVYVAHMGFDAPLFQQFQEATNEYEASKGAGGVDFWKDYRPFGVEEIMCGCGLLLRNGVSPVPQMALQFKDPRESFVFGDDRVRDVWKGENCGGSERRWKQFRSFFHIQTPNPFEWKKAPYAPPGPGADEKTGKWTKLNYETKGPLYKCEPMLSYCRNKWCKAYLPMLRPSGEVSECQICNTARGMRKPGERYQTMAHLRCKECNVNVCGAGCWQLLHGFYDTGEGKGEVLPCRAEVIEKAEDEEAVDEADDADGGDVADGENDDDDENM